MGSSTLCSAVARANRLNVWKTNPISVSYTHLDVYKRQRITEGLKLGQLWGQFKSEATATYGFYSKDVDRENIDREKSKFKRFWRLAWGLFLAMLMKLSPARRVLLIAAIIFLIVRNDNYDLGWLGAAILFLLLALELADRVTMKLSLIHI